MQAEGAGTRMRRLLATCQKIMSEMGITIPSGNVTELPCKNDGGNQNIIPREVEAWSG